MENGVEVLYRSSDTPPAPLPHQLPNVAHQPFKTGDRHLELRTLVPREGVAKEFPLVRGVDRTLGLIDLQLEFLRQKSGDPRGLGMSTRRTALGT